MKRDASYADKRIAEVLERPLPKRLLGVLEQYQVTPPRSDVAISLESTAQVNPLHLLKDQEEVTFGGVGGRAAVTVADLLRPSSPLTGYPVSKARQEMFAGTHHRKRLVFSAEDVMGLKASRELVNNVLFGPGTIIGVETVNYINPAFFDALVHEMLFGKVERHPRKALKSFKRASKAMVRGFLKEVKHG